MKTTLKKVIKAILPYGIVVIYSNYILPVLLYNYYKSRSKIHVYSIEETIEKLMADKCSMVRFGDGEMKMILGHGIRFQEYNEVLAKRLEKILENAEEGLLVCLPDVFEGLEKYKNKGGKTYWMTNLMITRKEWERICINKNYYNAFISRPYIMFLDINIAKRHFNNIIRIWDNENIILVEGEYSRLGCGNSLFDNTKSVKRILCPSKNAYNKYEEILKEVLLQARNRLILISLGPAAKLLVFDLYKSGYRALDIGHIDIEYEWYLKGAKEKIAIQGKYVNEAQEGNRDIKTFSNEKYENEIIKKII